MALVDPAVAVTAVAALSRLAAVIRLRALRPCRHSAITRSPQVRAAAALSRSTAGMSFRPIGARPRKVVARAMVLAVNWPPQAPAPGQADCSIAASSASSIRPAAWAPTASNTSWMVMSPPRWQPGRMLPPYSISPGRSSRARAIAAAGMVLSQPHNTTRPSRQWPSTTNSIESVITSRLTRDARMPSVPMAMPSVTAMVLNSMAVPPAASIPARTCSASSRRLRLQGETSDQECTTAISGLSIA